MSIKKKTINSKLFLVFIGAVITVSVSGVIGIGIQLIRQPLTNASLASQAHAQDLRITALETSFTEQDKKLGRIESNQNNFQMNQDLLMKHFDLIPIKQIPDILIK